MRTICLLGAALLSAPLHAAVTRYVALDGAHVPPFTNGWAGAATNIQLAVDACVDGDTVVVSNGVYNSDSRPIPSYGSQNRVLITNAITVRSLSGPAATIIEGLGPLGNLSVRGVYIKAGMLAGFTITNGHTRTIGTGEFRYYNQCGGGVNMYGGNGVISNCIMTGNRANSMGGGTFEGTVLDCVLCGNSAGSQGGGARGGEVRNSFIAGNSASEGGGLASATASNCLIAGCASGSSGGGGASASTLWHCSITGCTSFSGGGVLDSVVHCSVIKDNHAMYGGGAQGGHLFTCLIAGNLADDTGGGSFGGVLHNCTIVNNAAVATDGGGTLSGGLTNCIMWGNAAPEGSNYYASDIAFSCSWPLPDGEGNTNADPLFVNAALGDFRLLGGSLCIDRGTNLPWMAGATDLDGNPRIHDGTVDMGCYEFVPEPGSFALLAAAVAFTARRATGWNARCAQTGSQ
ncbi:hypothetical protein GX586_10150 [bacterium]|nr:hypothetical protein [bacterium]